jgi:NADH-quinone oxidoreductase subunit C
VTVDPVTIDPVQLLVELLGPDTATREDSFGQATVTVPPARWLDALMGARDSGFIFFDWLTAVDELDTGFAVVVHVYAMDSGHHLLIRTVVSRESPRLASITALYPGANWHERETFEMFGVVFEGHPDLRPLLLPDEFEGYPLRKDFVLASRVVKAWPGAQEPGESADGDGLPAGRRRMRPPGVPEAGTWGPSAGENSA